MDNVQNSDSYIHLDIILPLPTVQSDFPIIIYIIFVTSSMLAMYSIHLQHIMSSVNLFAFLTLHLF
jgi:hypothetical protein